MSEHPILFTGPMVRAILDGSKTMTRDTKGLKIINSTAVNFYHPTRQKDTLGYTPSMGYLWQGFNQGGSDVFVKSPYGKPGDTLWVKETFQTDTYPTGPLSSDERTIIIYCADVQYPKRDMWRSSILMPRWASRIQLRVTEIRVERIQDITEEDAIKEGIITWNKGPLAPLYFTDKKHVESCDLGHDTPRKAFRDLWDSIYAKRGRGWDVNPWVWCISFERSKP